MISCLCGGEGYESSAHVETFESTFLAAGSELKVRTLFVVDVKGSLPTSRAKVAFSLVHQLPSNLHEHAHIGMRDD